MVRPGLHHSLGKLSQEDQFKDMDFRILTISKGFNGVILPSHHNRGPPVAYRSTDSTRDH